MNTQEEKEIEELRKEINGHNHLYHVLDSPKITDYEYDLLFEKLKEIEARFPEAIIPHSPTQRVGAKAKGKAPMIKHSFPMLSLGNVFNKEELIRWSERIKKEIKKENTKFFCELKIDGLAISIMYKNGKFFKAITRGDGNEGEDVTNSVRTIRSLPLILQENPPTTLEVRGEIFVSFASFDELNRQQKNNKKELFSSARNLAAGSVRQLDPKIAAERKLEVFIYGVGEVSEDCLFPSTQEKLQQFLKKMGFRTSTHSMLCEGTKEVMRLCKKWENSFKELPFPVDGLVIKTNSFETQKTLGNTPREPKWAVAYKFPASQGITRLKEIRTSVGRTGRITPLGVLDPVVISGSKITYATLHNYDNILKKDIREGDFVVVEKAGEVIPKIKEPILEKRTGKEKVFFMPKQCPECLENLVKIEKQVAIKCENALCKGRIREQLKHFVSRGAMNIAAFGEKLSAQLIEEEVVKDVTDIYLLDQKKLETINRMGPVLANKIIENIKSSKHRPAFRLLYGLGILHVGLDTARILEKAFGGLFEISKATKTEMTEVKNIGEKTAESVEFFFLQKEHIEKIKILSRLGVQVTSEAVNKKKTAFWEKKLCITGTFEAFSRANLVAKIELLGGEAVSSVTKETDFLVVGENPGRKLQRAQELKISILKEKDFEKILEQEQEEQIFDW